MRAASPDALLKLFVFSHSRSTLFAFSTTRDCTHPENVSSSSLRKGSVTSLNWLVAAKPAHHRKKGWFKRHLPTAPCKRGCPTFSSKEPEGDIDPAHHWRSYHHHHHH